MSEILIKNAKIVNEGKIFKSDVLIKEDKIFEISNEILFKDHYILIDAENKLLSAEPTPKALAPPAAFKAIPSFPS